MIAKSKIKLVAVAFKSDNYCYCKCWKSTNNRESNTERKSCMYCIHLHVLNVLDLKEHLKSAKTNVNLQKSPFVRFRDFIITIRATTIAIDVVGKALSIYLISKNTKNQLI